MPTIPLCKTEDGSGLRPLRTKQDPQIKDLHATTSWLREVKVSHEFVSGPIQIVGTRSTHKVKRTIESYFDPQTPLPLSPSETASTTPSPGVHDDVWDSPLPSRVQDRSKSTSSITTPLTPPDHSSAALLIQTPGTASRKKSGSPENEGEESGEGVGRLHAEGLEDLDFEPQKIFRNLTEKLLAIKNANPILDNSSFDPNPDFEFGVASKLQYHRQTCRPRAVRALKALENNVESQAPKIQVPKCRLKHTSALTATLGNIIPTSVQSRIAEQRTTCVASLVGRPDQRCNLPCVGANVIELCREIPRYRTQNDASGLLKCIQTLIQAAMCGRHQNVAFFRKRWPILEDLVTKSADKSPQELAELEAWLVKVTEGQASSETSSVDTDRRHHKAKDVLAISLKPATERSPPAKYEWGLDHTVTAVPKMQYLDFKPYQPNRTKYKAVSDALLKIIAEPLKPTDLKPGFIYMFWDAGNFGKIKIGRTDNLKRRLKEWNRGCKREHKYLPAIERGELPEVAHVSRIERLIHTELKDYRRQAYCSTCRRHHQEWFEIEEAPAMEVFQKWQSWITQRPYEVNAETGEWTLRPQMMDSVDEMCQPIIYEEKREAKPQARVKRRGKKSKRPKGQTGIKSFWPQDMKL